MKSIAKLNCRSVARFILTCCLAGGMNMIAVSRAAEAAAPAAKSEPVLEKAESDYRNWFEVSAGIVTVDGDEAQFQKRRQLPARVFGGVEELHYEQDVGTNTTLVIEGRGIFDNNDYLLKLRLNNPDFGYLNVGYREFRSWYDGSGGFFRPNQSWFSLFDEELALDRGEAWFEGGLTLPNRPVFTFRYSHQFRDGRKDSLIWGESNLTGGLGGRGIVPSFRDIDEKRHTFAGDMTHTTGNTDWGLGVRYEIQDNNNSLNIRRRPTEPADRFLTQREGVELDMFNAHAFTLTRLTEKLTFSSGYSATTLDTDISGSRIYGPDYEPVYDPIFGRRQFRDEGFFNLHGGSQLNQYVLNLNLMYTPWESFTIVPAVRVEKQDLESVSEFIETNVGAAPRFTSVAEELLAESDRGLVDVSESLEARYTGFTNWVFYARGNWLQGEGDQFERERTLETGTIDIARETDFSRFTQKYTAGANWYPLRRLNIAAQYYHKIREDDWDHDADSTVNTTGNAYPAFLIGQNFETDDVNFRVTWRPFTGLTLVSRYDFQLSTIDTRGDGLKFVESAEVTSHILSETVTWSPLPRLYVQGSINYVWDQTDTPAAQATGTTNLVLNFDNDYWTASILTGYALTDRTDLEAQYFYYRADNYSDNSLFSQPYGAGTEEHGIIAGFTQRLRPNLRWSLKYGYFTNRDETSGGYNDYDAHMVYSNLRYLF